MIEINKILKILLAIYTSGVVASGSVLGSWLSPPKLEILDVKVSLRDHVPTASFNLGCGQVFVGIVKQEVVNGLAIGALAEQRSYQCLGMPKGQVIPLDYFTISELSRIQPYSFAGGGTYLLNRMIETRLILGSTKRSFLGREGRRRELQIVYEESCGVPVGAVIRRPTADSIEVGFLQQITGRPEEVMADCAYKQRKLRLGGLRLRPGTVAFPLEMRDSDPYMQFDFRLARIHESSLKLLRESKYPRIVYKQHCNEFPVGMVVRPMKKDSIGGAEYAFAIGALVIRFYNRRCNLGEEEYTWASLSNYNLRFPSSVKFFQFRGTSEIDLLRIKSPVSYAVIKNRTLSNDAGIEIDYYPSCDRPMGVVYDTLKDGKAAIAVLETTRNSSCKKQLKQLSWYQPFYTVRENGVKLYPLRILQ